MIRLALLLTVFLSAQASVAADALLHATEIILPGYQKDTLEKDTPVRDLLLPNSGDVWLLGLHGLWHWNLREPKQLVRVPLQKPAKGVTKLRHLGTDGVSLFAASANTLYQISGTPRRILKYKIPLTQKGLSLGFAGQADDFWWLHTSGFLQIDRYGKTLLPRLRGTGLKSTDKVHYQPDQKRVWYARGKELVRVDLGDKPQRHVLMEAKQPLLDLAPLDGGELVVHTAHVVLRLTEEGKLLQALPVEDGRKLVRMALSRETHAYLFHDGLLEVYTLNDRSIRRYRLPIGEDAEIGRMAIAKDALVLLEDGRPRAFRLASHAPVVSKREGASRSSL